MRREARAGSLESKPEGGVAGRDERQKRARGLLPEVARRTWLHLTRSYSPLNIGSDVDVRPLGGGRTTRRRLNRRSTLIPHRAVPIGLIGIERANFTTANGIVMSSVMYVATE